MKELIDHMMQISNSLQNKDEQSVFIGICDQLSEVAEKEEVRRKQHLIEKRIFHTFHQDTVNDLEEAYKKLFAQKKIIENHSFEQSIKLEELKFAYNELEQFTKVASHDLKEPLRSIANFSQLFKLKYKALLDEEGLEYLNYIINGTQQLDATFNDFLKYLQIGNNKPEFKITDFNDLLNQFVKRNEDIFNERNVTIKVANLPSIVVNAPMIYKLFQELVCNAIKSKYKEDPIIHITSEKIDDDFFLFKIQDNGIGLDMQHQEKLFLPFQRVVHAGGNHRPIGLAICKKIVKMHHGDIWYESENMPSKGTTFLFTIPIKAEQLNNFDENLLHIN